jgi:hypothetical protein
LVGAAAVNQVGAAEQAGLEAVAVVLVVVLQAGVPHQVAVLSMSAVLVEVQEQVPRLVVVVVLQVLVVQVLQTYLVTAETELLIH